MHVPALAFVHILTELGKRPGEEYAQKVWDVTGLNYEVRCSNHHSRPNSGGRGGHGIFAFMARRVLQAWDAREAFLREQDNNNNCLDPPRIVTV